jgi:hypothetical protein
MEEAPNKEGGGGEGLVLSLAAGAGVASPGKVRPDVGCCWAGAAAANVGAAKLGAVVLLLPAAGGTPNPSPNAGALAPEPNRGAVLLPKAGVLAPPNSEGDEEGALLKEVPNRPPPVEAEEPAPPKPPKAGPLELLGTPNPSDELGIPKPRDVLPAVPKAGALDAEVGAAPELAPRLLLPNPKEGNAGWAAPAPG